MVLKKLSNHIITKQSKIGLYLSIGLVCLTGCSSSIFKEEDKAQPKMSAIAGTGEFNEDCLNLNLGRADLDVGSARTLVNCLNANGSIQEYAILFNRLSDTQLQSLLTLVNRHVMLRPDRLRLIDQSMKQADERQIIDRTFSTLAPLLDQPRAIMAAIRILQQGAYVGQPGIVQQLSTRLFSSSERGTFDTSILKSIRMLATELSNQASSSAQATTHTRNNSARILESISAVAKSNAFVEISKSYFGASKLAPGITRDLLVRNLHEHIKSKIEEPNQVYLKTLAWGLVDGSLFTALDRMNHGQCDGGRNADCQPNHDNPTLRTLNQHQQIAAIEHLMRLLVSNQSGRMELLRPLTRLFFSMNRAIPCLANSHEIPNATLFVMDELTKQIPLQLPSWIQRTNTLQILLSNSLCSFPTYTEDGTTYSFNQMLEVLRTLAEHISPETNSAGRPLITTAHVIDALMTAEQIAPTNDALDDLTPIRNGQYRTNERYRKLLVNWLGDTGTHSAFNKTTDFIDDLLRRGVFGNILYLLSLPEATRDSYRPAIARDELQRLVHVLLKKRTELASSISDIPGSQPQMWRNIYDVFSVALLKIDVRNILDLAAGLESYTNINQPIIGPLAENLRESILLNDKNPILEILIDVALHSESDDNKAFFDTLFEVSEWSEFEQALRLTGRLAANGNLKSLINGVLMIFQGTINSVPDSARPVVVPPSANIPLAHNHAWSQRPQWQPSPTPIPIGGYGACRAIDVDIPFGQPFPANNSSQLRNRWNTNLLNLASCFDNTQPHREFGSVIRYAVSTEVVPNKSFAGFMVDLLARVSPTNANEARPILNELGIIVRDNLDDIKLMGRFFGFLLEQKYCESWNMASASPQNCQAPRMAFLQALGRVNIKLLPHAAALQRMRAPLQQIAQDVYLPPSAIWAYDQYQTQKHNTRFVPTTPVPLTASPLMSWGQTNNLRAQFDQVTRDNERVDPQSIYQQRVDLFRQEPVNHIQVRYLDHQNIQRVGFGSAERLKTHLKPLLDELTDGNRLDWFLQYLTYFDSNPYSPEFWQDWFHRAANNVRAIPFYYPGQWPGHGRPVTRFVSQLDLLELVVTESDFSLRSVDQSFGFLFGDVNDNFALKYLSQLGQSGQNMRPVIESMRRELEYFSSLEATPIIGATIKPEVKRRLFNLRTVFTILQEFNVERVWRNSDGSTVTVNDLGVLRDLFKVVLNATPEHGRNNYYRDRNSLAVVAELVKSGILRSASVNLISIDATTGRPAFHNILPLLRSIIEGSVICRADGERRINSDVYAITDYLLRGDCDRSLPKFSSGCVRPRSQWGTYTFNERYRTIGNIIDLIYIWSREGRTNGPFQTLSYQYIKRTAYELMGLLDDFSYVDEGDSEKFPFYAARLMASLKPLLASHAGTKLIRDQLDLTYDAFDSPTITHFVQRLRKSNDPAQRQHILNLRRGFHTVLDSLWRDHNRIAQDAVNIGSEIVGDARSGSLVYATYKQLNQDPMFVAFKNGSFDATLDKMKAWGQRSDTALRPRIHKTAGDIIKQGELDALILFLGRESQNDHFYNQIKFLAHSNGQWNPHIEKLNEFMDTLIRALALPRQRAH